LTVVWTDVLLEVRNLQVDFATGRGLVHAVDGVDLDVRHGEVLALVGESGCGKTTLVRSILGLERMSAGTVVFDGAPVSQRASSLRKLRRRVQMIFQDPSGALNPRHTIYEAVAEGIRIHKIAGDEPTLVADALARAGLRPPERYMTRYPHEVSGGQRQRVLIAGAMALGPRLLLADEPVASLDASIRGEILALMRSLVDAQGISIIAVTHDLGLAWNIADRVAVMYLGRIVELGAAEQVLSDPQHPYTQALLSVVPERERMEPQILTGETPDPSRIPSGCRFHPRCPLVASGQAARLGIEQSCRGVDVDLVELDPGHSVACHARA
jgi:oligopeptide/dipeptide ABC transporter ATP-binding protein